jgi:uncharacterized glyoxalase superfamily protein PhnB
MTDDKDKKAKKKARKQEKKTEKKQRKLEKKEARRGVPKGYHSVQAYLSLEDAKRGIDFYQAAFGARPKEVLTRPDGKVMHAEVIIGDSVVMLGDASPDRGFPATRSTFYVYVADCDAVYEKALAAGATPKSPPADMFWGDRYGSVDDPFGNTWSIATQKESLSPEEIAERAAAFVASSPSPTSPSSAGAASGSPSPPA